MNTITHLTPEWEFWLMENIERGCNSQTLVDAMVAKQFDPLFAGAIVYHYLQSAGRIDGAPVAPQAGAPAAAQRAQASGYRYEKPRIPMDQSVIRAGDRDVRVALRMDKPVVVVFDNVLSHEECDQLIALSRSKLTRSATVDPTTGQDMVIADRSSHGTFFRLREDDFIARIDERLAALMHWPITHAEDMQILNYQPGAEYKPHYDYFPPQDAGSNQHLSTAGQRVSTLVMYLNDVEEGGETVFPELGVAVPPRKGSAVYFEYCNSRSQVDPLTLHGGAPVRKGEKWIATKWLRERPFPHLLEQEAQRNGA
ncbi:2OG-Fe(II) oxygenase [Chitinilyticum piscinae]|uniref:2OG-Fe(II) oxygenase n=1 Tax=Chitinilyticum piscinae TaxID=2866724 RepID=A0A8J7FQ64_9NEIS|nr:2OG-Fe(II) oxygenase [Chitinilyticum piscinae]MBE9608631.1 2OG-Fe(II) oxygenase [Chitinilyticum piscinae]